MKRAISLLLSMALCLGPAFPVAASWDLSGGDTEVSVYAEVEGEDPEYPKAPQGYESFEDYREKSPYVHDTEFYYDSDTKTWYWYITNSNEIRSSKDLIHWTKEKGDRTGSAWAPCIIRLRQAVEFEGESYTYALWDSLSEFGTRKSSIRLWLSNSPKGDFVYAGDTVVSKLDDGKLHNAIDPSVFYDKEGRLWMTFGSFFGGIYLFELDPATCMAKEPDKLPGKRVVYRSTYLNSIEGATIIYNPDTDYYYMNVSYGSLDHTYNVRIGRSRNVEGPYYDYNGLPMDNEGYAPDQEIQIGTKITSPYYFEMDQGWYSTGHSAFLYNPDTNEYFLSHNARVETIPNGGTRLHVRKIYWTEDGWPVVSPELYAGEKSGQKIPTRCIPGVYQFIELLRNDLPIDPISAVKRGNNVLVLEEDHTVSGAYTGTWVQTGENTVRLTLGRHVYETAVSTAWDWENWTSCLVFTGLSEASEAPQKTFSDAYSGIGIWGKRVDPKILVDASCEAFTLAESVVDDLAVPKPKCKGVKVSLKSEQPDIISDSGELLTAKPEKDTTVHIKATFSLGRYSREKKLQVTVPGYKGSLLADMKLDGNLEDASPYQRAAAPGNGRYAYGEGILGRALRIETVDTTLENIIRLEDNIFHSGNNESFTINVWIKPDRMTDHTAVLFSRGNNRWLTMVPCDIDTKTPMIRVRDDSADVWSDLKAPNALELGKWTMMTYVYDKGTTILYLNGKEAARSDKILNPFNSTSQTFYLGGNQWDKSFDGLIDELAMYDYAWSGQQLKVYYDKTTAVPEPADRSKLADAVKEAKLAKEGIKVSLDGSDVDPLDFWVTSQEMDALEQAVKNAQTVADNENAAQSDVDSEIKKLEKAVEEFKNHIKAGNKKPDRPFIDVNESEWFYDYVYDVFDREIMTGLNPSEFGPAIELSRAQFAVILHRMEGSPDAEFDAIYKDVADGEFYTEAVMWASRNHIITGYTVGESAGNFGPADYITREQMAVMMYRYAKLKEYNLSKTSDLTEFPDRSKVSGFASKAMEWAVGQELIKGDDHKLNPQGNASRAQCATIIHRFLMSFE